MLPESATDRARDGDPAAGVAEGPARVLLHASCVELWETGVVLLGPSGSGKSDLAIRLIDGGARLVSDDGLLVERRGDLLIGSPPEAIAGLLEVRGLGVMRVDHCPSSRLGLAVTLGGIEPPRLPDCTTFELLGMRLPRIELDPRTPSACAKIRLALAAKRIE